MTYKTYWSTHFCVCIVSIINKEILMPARWLWVSLKSLYSLSMWLVRARITWSLSSLYHTSNIQARLIDQPHVPALFFCHRANTCQFRSPQQTSGHLLLPQAPAFKLCFCAILTSQNDRIMSIPARCGPESIDNLKSFMPTPPSGCGVVLTGSLWWEGVRVVIWGFQITTRTS